MRSFVRTVFLSSVLLATLAGCARPASQAGYGDLGFGSVLTPGSRPLLAAHLPPR